ncbi:MAG: cytochrome P450 [Actinomycetota bacterium]
MNIDLLSVGSYAGGQPHDQFAWLRENDPVHWHEEPDGPGFWALTRYDDVKLVGRDHERFSSSPTIMIEDPSAEGGLSGDHVMMLMADPPVHTRMRRLVSREFTPRAARELRARVGELATRIVDAVIERGECDLVTDLAGEMPSFVIADILGIPLEEGRELYHLTEAIHSSEEVVSGDARRDATMQMFLHSQRVWTDKRANPADDLASLLAHGEISGEPLDEVDFFLWFMLLVDAGGDTTRNLVGAGFYELFRHPAALDELHRSFDERIDTAIEELLRFSSPVIYMRRTATHDVVLGDRQIAAGDKVVMYYGAANRDPAVFEDPDRLDPTRSPNPHVAFGGGGPHFCLGAHLARVEIAALIKEMLVRLDDLQPTAEPEWMPSNFIYGPTHLPVSFTPGAIA